MPSYRSWSDTNQRGFEDALDALGVRFTSKGPLVETDQEMDRLAEDWGMTKKANRDEHRRTNRHS